MNKWITTALLAILWLTQPAVHAQDLSIQARPVFQHTGVISKVDPGTYSIVVDNVRAYLSPTVIVHGLHKTGSFDLLGPGEIVGWAPVGDTKESGTVTEIWILPPS